MRKQKMFAQKWDSDRSNWLSCIHAQANQVRREVGEAYYPNDWRVGWKEARKNGARVVPVWISLKP